MIRVEKAEMSMSNRYPRVEGNPALGIELRTKEKGGRWWLGIG